MTREEAIEILKQFKKCLSDVVFDEKGSEAWQMAISALEQKPCEDAIKWIPVSERLPELKQRILVSYETMDDGKKVDVTTYDKYGFLIGKAQAWMPLPKPYQKGGK